MKVAIIGRTEALYQSALDLVENNYEVVCILTAKESPEYLKSRDDFKNLSIELDVPFESSGSIKNYKNFFKKSSPDIAISINYPGIIPQEIIDIFPHGILNAHGGDLPRYRGNACQAWAILNGEKRIGICIHKMRGDELDSGDIIERDFIDISENTKIGHVLDWMNERIPKLFLSSLNKLQSDKKYFLEKQSTNPEDILRCYPRIPEDGKIDWRENSQNIIRLINASNKPYEGAFCKFKDLKMIIWDAVRIVDDEIFMAIPGQVTQIQKDFVEVACGKGKIRIFKVEFDNEIVCPSLIIKSIRERLN
tara:strand:+ start:392 stop:1312 length:921 start_codon:yes stop_codon:yes gene_type:complete